MIMSMYSTLNRVTSPYNEASQLAQANREWDAHLGRVFLPEKAVRNLSTRHIMATRTLLRQNVQKESSRSQWKRTCSPKNETWR
ncbi:hypothetical protein PISMIDRAFT_671451 [Pisolithus microcarpus 441]|uniref:Uncharacterized protein n=1 Tax=Pisolithus microcarpus 441 TaxID=765257 RepID=A0A0D0A728_9AGAM|nr:hypothetical protein PISMIDRAFT_671451 [Pisolithus microcarpus 441]